MILLVVASLGVSTPPAPPPRPVQTEPALKFTAEVVGDRPLPFQAVRLRVTAENVGKNPTPRLLALETHVWVMGVKRVGDTPLAPRGIPSVHDLPRFGRCIRYVNLDDRFALDSGARRTVSFAVGGDPDATEKFCFPEPGKYVLRCQYLHGAALQDVNTGEAGSVYAEVTVEVRKPGDKDKPWVDALTSDPDLACALIQPRSFCSEKEAAVIERLIAKAPDSSYADYGRLALALHILVNLRQTDDNFLVQWRRAVGILDAMAERTESAGFAFLPYARLYNPTPTLDRIEHREKIMNRDFRDAMEWLAVVAGKMTHEEWEEFRKPLPAKGEPKK